MRSAIEVTALALIAVTVTPVAANARAPRIDAIATSAGPESDYPLVVGDAFSVDGKTYVPSDTMNYDAVGYAEAGDGGDIVTGTHRTLPLPSYVEVTSLTSGKTILVRLTRRGPMAGTNLLALSPGAWALLGLGEGAKAPVRVRRVNPPEPERAQLRLGQHAPDRMETPPGLLAVLKRKLGEGSTAVLSESARGAAASAMAPPPRAVTPELSKPAIAAPKPPMPTPTGVTKLPAKATAPRHSTNATIVTAPPVPPKAVAAPSAAKKPAKPAASATVARSPAAQPAPTPVKRGQSVQVGAFSSEDRAKVAAAKIGAQISQLGKVWRVRFGPFADRASADRGLAKARAAGYHDARIVREP